MKNVLVVFENKRHIDSSAQKFIDTLDNVVHVVRNNNLIVTNDTTYKLIGAGFPYVSSLGDKLNGMRFDDVMIHGDVVLTRKVEWYIKSRMEESKEFIEFEL